MAGQDYSRRRLQPTLNKDEVILVPESREGSPVIIEESPEPDDFALVPVHSIDDSESDEDEDCQITSSMLTNDRSNVAKRRYSQVSVFSDLAAVVEQDPKRKRLAEERCVKETREGISRINLKSGQMSKSRKVSKIIGLSSDSTQTSTPASLPQTIDLASSDLATPPETGSIRAASRSSRQRVVRTADQKLTTGTLSAELEVHPAEQLWPDSILSGASISGNKQARLAKKLPLRYMLQQGCPRLR